MLGCDRSERLGLNDKTKHLVIITTQPVVWSLTEVIRSKGEVYIIVIKEAKGDVTPIGHKQRNTNTYIETAVIKNIS